MLNGRLKCWEMNVVARLRDPRGVRTLQHAAITAGTATLEGVDAAKETVAVQVPVVPAGGRSVVRFVLDVLLE